MKGHRYWVAVVFFLLAAAPGCWWPALANTLEEYGLGRWVATAFMIPNLAGMISPLIFGAQVDQRWQAQKVLGWIMISGAGFLFMAFYSLENQWGGGWFLFFFGINSLISAPAWSLLITIALSNLPESGSHFGLYRVWGTLGWMAASFTVSFCNWDLSAKNGQLGAVIRIFAAITCFLLPVTEPKGEPAKHWSDAIGWRATSLLKERDLFVYFLAAFLFTVPLGAFYMHTPMHLKELGASSISSWMATGQILETVAMLGMGYVIARFRVKSILLMAMLCGVMRYAFYSVDGLFWLVVGIVLHGVCWTFFFEAGKVFLHRRVSQGIRGQAQALLGFFTGGLGGTLGVLVVNAIHDWVYPVHGWSGYWMTLTGINTAVMIFFALGYRGLPQQPPEPIDEPTMI